MNTIWPAWPSNTPGRGSKGHKLRGNSFFLANYWEAGRQEHRTFPSFIHRCNTHPWMSANKVWTSSPEDTGPCWEKHG
eukprot:731484-Pelagomonas_calceolata.AAC.1